TCSVSEKFVSTIGASGICVPSISLTPLLTDHLCKGWVRRLYHLGISVPSSPENLGLVIGL
ncbi:MAG: hypothetical protein LBF76_01175, partial [Holosporales bacterium]|nr:hypothetical protein [Holosporales bacterium]